MNVAQRYAKSLLDLAIEQHIAELVYNDLLLINKILNENKDLCIVLQSPIICLLYTSFTDPISAPLRSTLTVASMLLRLMIFPRLTKAFNSGTSSRKARATMRVSKWVSVVFTPSLRFFTMKFSSSVTSMSTDP